MKTTFIYILVDPRNDKVRYVGKSNTPYKRLLTHQCDKRKSHVTAWIKQLAEMGLKPHQEIIDEVKEIEWQFWEMHYISLYRSWGFDLTNHSLGGFGSISVSITTRAKMSLSKIGITWEDRFGEEVALKMRCKASDLRKGVSKTSDAIQKMKANHSYWSLGTKQSQEHINKRVVKYSKQIVQKDLENNFIKEWQSAHQAARELNITQSNIVSCLKKKTKKANGYKWEYKN